jgi:hypothetical protein
MKLLQLAGNDRDPKISPRKIAQGNDIPPLTGRQTPSLPKAYCTAEACHTPLKTYKYFFT